MNEWLIIPSLLFRQGVWLRGRLYDHGILPVRRMSCTVVSIGNITVGGTGKTPFAMWLLQRLQRQALRAGFVSRGYKSSAKTVRDVECADPATFGDEPSQVRLKFPSLPVFVGPDRSKVIQALLAKSSVDVVVADDAFQHRRLHRDLDIVLLDALEPDWHYSFLPQGRAREGLGSLRRAQFVVISKANLVSPETMAVLDKRLAGFRGHRLKMNYLNGGYSRLDEFSAQLTGTIFLITGVGRPESVRRLLPEIGIAQHKIFPDHYQYKQSDADRLLLEFKKSGARHLVTTEKDAVKLRCFPELARVIWQMDLKTDVQGDLDELDREILRLVRARG